MVATTPEQIPALHKLMQQAQRERRRRSGAADARDEAKRLEPQLSCVAAFHSPSTGIIDTHGLMLSLLGEAEARGAALARHAPVERGWLEDDGRVTLQVGGADPMQVTARLLINAAGLGAQEIARKPARLSRRPHPAAALCQGQLLQPERPLALLAPHLSDAGSRRPRRASDARPRGPGALRPRRRMDRSPRLRCRPAARRCVLRRDPHLLAAPARRCLAARLCRHPPQDPGAGRDRPPISASMGRRCTASRVRCISMASSRPASPHAWPSPTRSPVDSVSDAWSDAARWL